MPSSPDTTESFDIDDFCERLDRRLEKIAEQSLQRKLASGEYVMFEGRPVPARLVAEAEAEAERARVLLTELSRAQGKIPIVMTAAGGAKKFFQARSALSKPVSDIADEPLMATIYAAAGAMVGAGNRRIKYQKTD